MPINVKSLIIVSGSAMTALVLAATTFAAFAIADVGAEEQQGRELLGAIRSGDKHCTELSAGDLELIGEYAMGRFLHDTSSHQAMNRHMTATMGSRGERRMHMALGYRLSGCRGGPAWGWVSAMGLMMSDHYVSPGPGMMGGHRGTEWRGHGSSMMQRTGGQSGDGDIGIPGVILIAFAAALVGAGLVALVNSPPSRGARSRDGG